MKPPTPKTSDYPAPGVTQVIDLHDVEVLVAQAAEQAAEHERSLPPPLPPEVRASQLPESPVEPPVASRPPASHTPSFQPPSVQPAQQAPAPSRSTAFYALALLAFLALGVGGGVVVAMTLRKAPSVASNASKPGAKPQGAVITIPTVEVDDDPDGGK